MIPDDRPEHAQMPAEVPKAEEHKLLKVVMFLPAGGVEIPGPQAVIDEYPNGAMYVDAIQPDGSVQRYVNVPFVMVLASNRLVQPVSITAST